MQDTDYSFRSNRVTLRVSRHSMSFSVADTASEYGIRYEPYTVKSGMSVAANLREAFTKSELLGIPFTKALIMVDTPVLYVPLEYYHNENPEILYRHSFPGHDGEMIMRSVIPDLNVVVVYAVNKDLNVVVNDHFSDISYSTVCQPVWSFLHSREEPDGPKTLYGYFHDRKLDIFSFERTRFRFCNTFKAEQYMDAVYFLLYVWQQLGYDARRDCLQLIGQVPDRDALTAALRRYVLRVYALNPAAELNRAPITQIRNIPFDLIARYTIR